MSTSLIHVHLPPEELPLPLTQTQAMLRQMVLDTVPSVHSKRNYAKASTICLSSVPADLSPAHYCGIQNDDGSPISFNY